MLQMNCSHCGGLIKSPKLAEMQVMICPECEEIVAVKNVVIADKMTPLKLRPSLTGLLVTARDKFLLGKPRNLDLQAKYDINRRLAKLLRRDDFRLTMSFDLYVQIEFEEKTRLGRLLNISSTGAAVELNGREQVPAEDMETHFQMLLPGQDESLTFPARIIWSKKPAADTISPVTTMGMQFNEIDEKTRENLWDFIVKTETESAAQT